MSSATDDHLLAGIADDDLTVVAPRLTGDPAVGRMVSCSSTSAIVAWAQGLELVQQHRGDSAVFGLSEQVCRAQLAVDRVIGNDERLGGASEEVDADASVQLPLGFARRRRCPGPTSMSTGFR
jgi:hypothetical protein